MLSKQPGEVLGGAKIYPKRWFGFGSGIVVS